MKFETKKKGATSAFLSALMLAGVGLGAPSMAAADEEAAAGLQFIIVSDDLRKTTTETERAGDSPAAPAAPGGEAGADAGADDAGDGNGNGNNGHGNNLDGVDVSNPGQGDGGPNGAVDASGDVDDEAGGGAGSNGNGNGNGKSKSK